ncbi:hypothetical protein MASR2M15_04740 [Anaerolineales bacterium]
MATIQYQTSITGSIFDVFTMATDFEHAADLQDHITHSTVTSGNPIRSGTMISQNRKWMGGNGFYNADVLDYQRYKEITLKGVFNRYPFTRTIKFESTGGKVLVKDSVTFRVGCLYFWYAPLLNMRFKGQMKQEWETIKRKVEKG